MGRMGVAGGRDWVAGFEPVSEGEFCQHGDLQGGQGSLPGGQGEIRQGAQRNEFTTHEDGGAGQGE